MMKIDGITPMEKVGGIALYPDYEAEAPAYALKNGLLDDGSLCGLSAANFKKD